MEGLTAVTVLVYASNQRVYGHLVEKTYANDGSKRMQSPAANPHSKDL